MKYYAYLDECGLTEFGPFDDVPEALAAMEGYAHNYTVKIMQCILVSRSSTKVAVSWEDPA